VNETVDNTLNIPGSVDQPDGGRVVVVGSINMDLVVTTDHIPVPGETVLGGSFSTLPGGKGANQAVAAARAGAAVTMVGRLGPDAFGDALRSGLIDERVDVTHVGTCKHDPSGVALISVADSGENAIVVAPGANATIRSVHIDDAAQAGVFEDGGILLTQLEIPVDVMAHAVVTAHRAGLKVILNPAPAKSIPDAVLSSVDVIVANETEIEQLGGLSALLGRVATVVETLGSEGIVVHTDGEAHAIGALEVDVVDTTGAGDCFCGWLAAGMARGLDVVAAAAMANVAAGLSVERLGARGAPDVVTVDRYLAE
jgi:ribokinase